MITKSINTVICMTDNQVDDIKLTYREKVKNNSIELPPIYSLNRWLTKEFQEFCMVSQIDKIYSVLNGIEEKILWEKIIKRDLKEQKIQKKQIDNITEKVISADKIIRQYKIKNTELKAYEHNSEEQSKLNKW